MIYKNKKIWVFHFFNIEEIINAWQKKKMLKILKEAILKHAYFLSILQEI